MLSAGRREFILDMVRTRGVVRLRDLTGELGVSTATVRRDVTVLAERGLIARVHGAIKPVHAENDYRAGGDGSDPTDHLVPPSMDIDLTTVHLPHEELGRTAVRLALEHATHGGAPQHVVLGTHLVVRGSVRPRISS